MARLRIDPTEAKLKRRERNQRYRENIARRQHEKEQDRQYQQRKRDQQRLRQHEDPLAQLADVGTQQEYLTKENDVIVEGIEIELGEGEDSIEVSGMVEEDGEVLENLGTGAWEEGLNDDWGPNMVSMMIFERT